MKCKCGGEITENADVIQTWTFDMDENGEFVMGELLDTYFNDHTFYCDGCKKSWGSFEELKREFE